MGKTVKKATKDDKEELETEEIVNKILAEKDYYYRSAAKRRETWSDCWKMYNSYIDDSKNPFLANLFIPKTHEAVELAAAFLTGGSQSIKAEAEGKNDTQKALFAGKFLEFLWRKVLNIKDKLLTFVKQGILFGNGFLKCGWDVDKRKPFVEVLNITDILFDYYYRDIQDSPSVIHIIRRNVDDIKENKAYNDNRSNVIGDDEMEDKETSFNTYDDTIITIPSNNVATLFERWTKKEVILIAPTSFGFKILRRFPNPFKDSDGEPYYPFVKFRLKNNPLSNRAYDIGGIEPTIKIQMAFNDTCNEFFDNVSLINNKMWKKRRGANISPMDLVRRPGGIITCDDPATDLIPDEVGDVKQSIIEMLRFLDSEFQQASMISNLIKAMPGTDSATEASLIQANAQTMLGIVDNNLRIAMSELGQMILDISLQHLDEMKEIKLFETDDEEIWAEAEPENIKGKYDIRISADRTALESKVVRQKQLLDFVNILRADPMTLQKYPDALTKLYKLWLSEAGFGDVDYIFEKIFEAPAPVDSTAISSGGESRESLKPLKRGELLTPAALEQAVASRGFTDTSKL